jgi:hypothetical protein
MATIKYNTDNQGNIKVITKDGKVSCECCACVANFSAQNEIEISKEVFNNLLKGFTITAYTSSIFTNRPFGCFDNLGFSSSLSISKNDARIYCGLNIPLGVSAVGFFSFRKIENKYYIAFVSGSFGGNPSIYFAFLRAGASETGLFGPVPNSYVTNFSGSFTINGQEISGVWYNTDQSCGSDEGATVSATISISITTNDP